MSKQPKAEPKFASEAEERVFWETHDSTEYLDWSKSQKARSSASLANFGTALGCLLINHSLLSVHVSG